MDDDTSTPNTTIAPPEWHVRRDDEGGPAPKTPPTDLGSDWRPTPNGID